VHRLALLGDLGLDFSIPNNPTAEMQKRAERDSEFRTFPPKVNKKKCRVDYMRHVRTNYKVGPD
jgi:hypothetical protein